MTLDNVTIQLQFILSPLYMFDYFGRPDLIIISNLSCTSTDTFNILIPFINIITSLRNIISSQ